QLAHLGHQVVAGDLELLVPGRPLAAGRAALPAAAGIAAAGTARASTARASTARARTAAGTAAGTTRCGLAPRFLLAAPQVPFLGAPLAPEDLSIAELLSAGEGSPRSPHPSRPCRGGATGGASLPSGPTAATRPGEVLQHVLGHLPGHAGVGDGLAVDQPGRRRFLPAGHQEALQHHAGHAVGTSSDL